MAVAKFTLKDGSTIEASGAINAALQFYVNYPEDGDADLAVASNSRRKNTYQQDVRNAIRGYNEVITLTDADGVETKTVGSLVHDDITIWEDDDNQVQISGDTIARVTYRDAAGTTG